MVLLFSLSLYVDDAEKMTPELPAVMGGHSCGETQKRLPGTNEVTGLKVRPETKEAHGIQTKAEDRRRTKSTLNPTTGQNVQTRTELWFCLSHNFSISKNERTDYSKPPTFQNQSHSCNNNMFLIPSYHHTPVSSLFDDLLAFDSCSGPRLCLRRTAEKEPQQHDDDDDDKASHSSENHVRLSVDVPGVKLADLQVSVKDDEGSIHIVGHRTVLGAEGKVVKRSKIEKRFLLNTQTTDLSQLKAHLADGVLTLEAPNKPKVEARTIPILVSREAPAAAAALPQLQAAEPAPIDKVPQDKSDTKRSTVQNKATGEDQSSGTNTNEEQPNESEKLVATSESKAVKDSK